MLRIVILYWRIVSNAKKNAQCWEYVQNFMSREAAYKENTAL